MSKREAHGDNYSHGGAQCVGFHILLVIETVLGLLEMADGHCHGEGHQRRRESAEISGSKSSIGNHGYTGAGLHVLLFVILAKFRCRDRGGY